MPVRTSWPCQRLWCPRVRPSSHRCRSTRAGTNQKESIIQQTPSRQALAQRWVGKNKVEIVSPELCDDVLDYFGPSLRKHRHCDIIDINPGVCLWSAKLHEYLQPRIHLLLEPNAHFVDPFIKPLLEKPGSKYRHASYDTEDWETYKRIFDEGFVQPSMGSNADQSQFTKPIDSLLVIGNFAYVPRSPVLGFDSLAHLAINHFFYRAIRQRSHVHAHGLVRMLLWMSHEDTYKILPTDIFQRGKFAVDQDISGSVTMVAGPGKLSTELGLADLEENIMTRVRESMAHSNMCLPSARQTLDYQDTDSDERQSSSKVKALSIDHRAKGEVAFRWDSKRELVELMEIYGSRELDNTKKQAPKAKSASGPKWQKYLQLRRHYRTLKSIHKKLSPLVAIFKEITDLELALTAKDMLDDTKSRMAVKLQDKVREFKAKASNLGRNQLHPLALITDNLWARERDQSLLQWDQRAFEPLKVEKDEFYPASDVCLLDFQPKAPAVFTRIDESDDEELAAWFFTHLFLKPTNPVTKALDSCAPGAADALVPQAPSLTDPWKGGRLDPSQLRVRLLTVEMIEELIKAWSDWPFRPDLSNLHLTGQLGGKYTRSGMMH